MMGRDKIIISIVLCLIILGSIGFLVTSKQETEITNTEKTRIKFVEWVEVKPPPPGCYKFWLAHVGNGAIGYCEHD